MVEPLDVHVELLIGEVTLEGLDIDNAWLDITGDVRGAPSQGGIRISRGTAAEGQRPSPGSMTMLINNCDGRYSPRNAEGPLYGYIGRNTQIRTYVDFPTPTVRSVSTATPGDVDEFAVAAPAGMQEGDVLLAFQSFATPPADEDLRLPSGDGWMVAREAPQVVTEDSLGVAWWKVAQPNEPANYTFYNPLGGEAVVAILAIEGGVMDPPGITEAQFARELATTNLVTTPAILPVGSSDLEVRWAAGSPVGAGVTWTPPVGFTEQADINDSNAITGSVATRALTSTNITTALDFTASGNVDLGHGLTVTISSRSYRFHGEVSEWPPRASCGDGNLWVPITASGPLRRLNQGSEAISSMRKFYEDLEAADPTDVWAYWPLEDGGNAIVPLPGIENGVPMTIPAGQAQFAASSALFGSQSTIVLESGTRLQGNILQNVNGLIHTSALYAFGGNQPDNGAVLIEIRTTGSVAVWRIIYSTGFIFTMSGFDGDGALIGSTAALNLSSSMTVNSRFLLTASMTQSGADAVMSFNVTIIDDNYLVTQNGIGGLLAGRTIGIVKQVRIGTGLTNVTIGHLAIGNTAGVADATDPAIIGHFGEQAAYRIKRLLDGTGVIFIADLSPYQTAVIPSATTETGTTPMGEEPVDTLVNKIQQTVETDRGVLYEDRNRLGLIYKAPDALYNQAPTAPLEYGDLGAPLDPMDDDLLVSNDVTVSQVNGSQARVVETTGPLSIQVPPAGVGTYTGGASVNAASDLILPDIANWLLRLGTWDDFRFDRINIRNLAILDCPTNPPLVRFAAALDPGDVISIDDLPDWLPPDLIRQLVRGSEEFLDKYDWSMSFNTVPAGPYDVGILSEEGAAAPAEDAPMRYSSQGTETSASFVAGTDTTLSVETLLGPLWTTTPGGSFDIRVSGVRLRVTAISAATGQFQDFTVEQTPINGIIKTIPAGTEVALWTPAVFAK